MGKRIGVLGLLAFLFLSLPAISYGQLITIQISGKVTYLHEDFLGINLGDPIVGIYTYDSSVSDLDTANPNFGEYRNLNSLTGISVNIGSYNFRTNPDNAQFIIKILNSPSYDYYSVLSRVNSPLASYGRQVYEISWLLKDSTGTAISNDTLPMVPPNLLNFQNWPDSYFLIHVERNCLIKAEITSAVLIPEPTTLLLAGLGIVVIRKFNRLTK